MSLQVGKKAPEVQYRHCLQPVVPDPNGRYTAHLATPVPKAVPGMVFGTRVLRRAVYGPFGSTKRYLTNKLHKT